MGHRSEILYLKIHKMGKMQTILSNGKESNLKHIGNSSLAEVAMTGTTRKSFDIRK